MLSESDILDVWFLFLRWRFFRERPHFRRNLETEKPLPRTTKNFGRNKYLKINNRCAKPLQTTELRKSYQTRILQYRLKSNTFDAKSTATRWLEQRDRNSRAHVDCFHRHSGRKSLLPFIVQQILIAMSARNDIIILFVNIYNPPVG